MFKPLACSLAFSLMCSPALLAADKPAADTAAPDAAAPAAAKDTDAAAPVAQDPTQMFVTEAYIANLFEVQAGQLAAQKAMDNETKQFARMMVEDHTKANQKLKQVAQSINVPVSEQLDAVHQAKLQKMQQIPAADFTRKYINSQVAGHMMNVLEFRYQSQNAQNQQVKQYATQTLPKLQQHLTHVTRLAEQQVSGARAAGAHEAAEKPQPTATERGGSRDAASDRSNKSGKSGTSDDAAGTDQSK